MKTKVLAALAATMAVGATCAFAANPFVDVPSDSWAYKSVVELADAGIIQGVDGQYFQGNRNITRYEAAEMVAKAMAHMDKASVEQRALINKLADEYADELNNLGVRVSALENRVGNVKLTGDARIRYRYQSEGDKIKGTDQVVNAKQTNDNSWDYRVRVRANAQVNDRTNVVYGITTGVRSFADNSSASSENNVTTDRAYVDYNFGGNNWDLMVGRYEYIMGGPRAYGFFYGDTFDGAQLKYQNDKFAATAGYGKFKEGPIGGAWTGSYNLDADNDYGVEAGKYDVEASAKTAYGELEGFFGGGRMAVFTTIILCLMHRLLIRILLLMELLITLMFGVHMLASTSENGTLWLTMKPIVTLSSMTMVPKTMLMFGLASSPTVLLTSLRRNLGTLGLNTSMPTSSILMAPSLVPPMVGEMTA